MLIIILSLGCLLSCGLEEFYFLDAIPDGYVTYIDTTGTNIRLSSGSSSFENFVIFYRIYISETNISGQILTAEQRTSINPALNSDFNAIFPWTDKTSTTVNTANLENSFLARRYYQLTLQGSSINGVLDTSSLGRRLEIRFTTQAGESPFLLFDDITPHYLLQRANSAPGMNFRPLPEDRLFFSHADLRNSNNATAEINADVASHSSVNPLYAYVSMYIAATGRTLDLPPRTIFSQPTFIGIFRLTENP